MSKFTFAIFESQWTDFGRFAVRLLCCCQEKQQRSEQTNHSPRSVKITISKLVQLLSLDNFTVGSVAAEHVFAHHGKEQPAPLFVLVDHNAHGEG